MKYPSVQGPVQDDNVLNNDQTVLYLQLASHQAHDDQVQYQLPNNNHQVYVHILNNALLQLAFQNIP